jgi:hypothetical protein
VTKTKDLERAQAAFHKEEQQRRDGADAMLDYRAREEAQRNKTAKLRALRLAKEGQDRKAEIATPSRETKTKKQKAK